MDFETARFNMVEQQIRPWDVLNQEVLDLLFKIKREDFVTVSQRQLAFVDTELPLPHGGKMLQPKLEARIVQDVMLLPTDTVLEIGTGSGYLTALLATLAKYVYSIDNNIQAHHAAAQHLAQAGITNVSLEIGNGACGLSNHGPYNVIVLGGSVPVLPEHFKQQLAVGGRLFAIIGEDPVMSATLITRMGETEFSYIKLFETIIDVLDDMIQTERFEF